MDQRQLRQTLAALRDRLTTQQRSIRDGVIADAGHRDSGRAPINFAEQASDEQELDLMAERLTAASETLADIDDAIERIDAGRFNVCDGCGREIGVRRLSIQPWTSHCVACQRELEREGRP